MTGKEYVLKVNEEAARRNPGETEFLNAFGGLEMIKYDLKMRRAIDVLKK